MARRLVILLSILLLLIGIAVWIDSLWHCTAVFTPPILKRRWGISVMAGDVVFYRLLAHRIGWELRRVGVPGAPTNRWGFFWHRELTQTMLAVPLWVPLLGMMAVWACILLRRPKMRPGFEVRAVQ